MGPFDRTIIDHRDTVSRNISIRVTLCTIKNPHDAHCTFLRRAIEAADSRSYGAMLRGAPEFLNPSDVSNMASAFGLGDNMERQPSLMRGLFR